MSFTTQEDVANRALQHLGVPRISAITNSSKQAREARFAINKARGTVLRGSVWTSATRRCVMRPIISTTKSITFPSYDAAVTYATGDIVADTAIRNDTTGFLWISTAESNLANTPGASGVNAKWVPYFGARVAEAWSGSTAYLPGDMVYETTVVYIAVAATTNNDPPNTSYWHVVASATPATIIAPWPMGYENDGSTLRKIYRLPANFLRMAPQDPKAAAVARQNVAAGMQFNDWEVEAGHLLTADASGFVMRFVADQADVAQMDPLLCEVWAAQLAKELCEPLTQSPEKFAAVSAEFTRFMNMAKMVNAIEAGTTEEEPMEAPPQQRQGR